MLPDAFSGTTKSLGVLATALLALPMYSLARRFLGSTRQSLVNKKDERVLILGATSGIGESVAHLYAARAAKVCVVGRRQDRVQSVQAECQAIRDKTLGSIPKDDQNAVLGIPGDFSNVEDMVHLRTVLEQAWNGVDTIIVSAGVSALRPLMETADVERTSTGFSPAEATAEGIQKAVDISNRALQGNFTGPLVAAIAFIPLLQATSKAPTILLVSSLAAVVPAPTRSIYASTKSASLLLYQALAIEHRKIKFSYILPSTVEGDFRASAVDAGPVREADPNKHGLKRVAVAQRCIDAVDGGEKAVFMPVWFGRGGHILYWLFPSVAEWVACKKYKFPTS